MSKNKCKRGELVAKVKFWFGQNEPIFNKQKYIIENNDYYAYIYKKGNVCGRKKQIWDFPKGKQAPTNYLWDGKNWVKR